MSIPNVDEVMDTLYHGRDMSDIGKGLESKRDSMKAQRVVKPSNDMAGYESPKIMMHEPNLVVRMWGGLINMIDDTVRQIPAIISISKGFLTVFGMVSLCYFGCAIFAPDKLLNGSLEGITGVSDDNKEVIISSEEEKLIMKDLGKYCFNKIPMYNDARMCASVENTLMQQVGNLDRQLNVYKDQAIETSNQVLQEAKTELNHKFPRLSEKSVNPSKG